MNEKMITLPSSCRMCLLFISVAMNAGILNAQPSDAEQSSPARGLNAFVRPFPEIQMDSRSGDYPELTYLDVGNQIPNYVKSDRWGELGEPLSVMQQPLSPEQAMQHIVMPIGFHVELYASEPDLTGKPISMSWDERGRLWICETIDYPNELNDSGMGRDLIRICEDTNADGRADKFTVFAENLSIPSALAFVNDGVIVQNGNETIFLKDTDGDDVSDVRTTFITGWAMGDTHGGVSNFQYGLDNWIWAMQGYNASAPVALGKPQQPFRMGFFRMRPDGSEVEFLRSTNNNTWGLGISEEGLVFGSTANGNPSVFMPIPNRYYERVRGWAKSLTLSSIADSNRFLPVTDRVRQVDHFGGYTAAAGHSLYTARQYPEAYWNRVAFVCEPTGHLVASFVLSQTGSGFAASNPFNLFASHDEWSAPIMAEVGPDGSVWVIDWYNYIVQHNPTPKGFQTGKGNAYESNLRDKKYGRIYRIVCDNAQPASNPNLESAGPEQLVAALKHSVMLVRKHAQRLLVERGNLDLVPNLVELLEDTSVDSIGLNAAAIHALWALHGLKAIDARFPKVMSAVYQALRHPSAGVRRNAVQVLPPDLECSTQILEAMLLKDSDANVRLAALLALSDLPSSPQASSAIIEFLSEQKGEPDQWLIDAATCAAAGSGVEFLIAVGKQSECSETVGKVARVVAEHVARGEEVDALNEFFESLDLDSQSTIPWIVTGLSAGWKPGKRLELSESSEAALKELIDHSPLSDRSAMVRLTQQFGSSRFRDHANQLVDELLTLLESDEASDDTRIAAARHAVEFQPDSDEVATRLVDALSPRISPALAQGIVDALAFTRSELIGKTMIDRLSQMPPAAKTPILGLLLKRPAFSLSLLEAIENRQVPLTDLALDQRQTLSRHPDPQIREAMKDILRQGGSLPNLDRQQVLVELAGVAHEKGDKIHGKAVFVQHCSKCHIHLGVGASVGPALNGMSVHPKEEMLTHILDPNRSVESNFRSYSVLTVDGLVFVGMLAAETKTAIELFDTDGKRQVILREDIEQLNASPQSIMPEGFEKTLTAKDLTDLLEYLATRDAFVPLDISKVATAASDRGMFVEYDGPEKILFDSWGDKSFQGIPFQLIQPRDGRILNAIVLHSRLGNVARQHPKYVSLICNTAAKSVHILGGVAGWAYPLGKPEEVALIVRLHYEDGESEDHELLNGVHIADYVRRIDVPKSQNAYSPGGKQMRYLAIHPERTTALSSIEFIKGDGDYAPVIMAVTVEPLQAE